MTHLPQSNISDPVASMRSLKQTARTAQDIETWLSKNLWACGLTDIDSAKTGVVNLGFSIHTAIQDDFDNPILKVNVSVSLQDHAKAHSAAATYFNMEDELTSTATANYRMFLSFQDWPFLSAHLAMLSLQGLIKVTPLSAPRVDRLLTKFIPEHFPGMTWEGLQAMYAGELLPLLFENRLDEPATLDILYASRNVAPSVNMPDAFSL